MNNSGDAGLLLELAADDNLPAFQSALLRHPLPLSSSAPWYGPTTSSRQLSVNSRTPAMIAALHGSTAVLSFILSSSPSEALRHSPSDLATPLHLAALSHNAHVASLILSVAPTAAELLDSNGRRPADVVVSRSYSPRTLEKILKSSAAGRFSGLTFRGNDSTNNDRTTLNSNHSSSVKVEFGASSANVDDREYLSNSKPSSPVKTEMNEFGVDSVRVERKESLSNSKPASPVKGEFGGNSINGERKELGADSVKGEKREFAMDSTMPDIKEGVFGTDEFRMYQFKVRPCSRAYSHDWTECPFVHPGENARRRDPKKFTYSCVPCPEFKKGGNCRNGDGCEYAHGVFESWLHPAQYKTRLCKDEIGCSRRVCFFAHKPEEIRQVNPSAVSIGGGMVVSSPKGTGLSSNLDMATALMLMQQQQPQQSVSAAGSTVGWMNQNINSPLQSQGNRLRNSLSARDLDFELESLGLESYRNKLIDEISANSPRLGLNSSSLTAAAASRGLEYSDLLGSVDPSLLTQLQGLSVKQQSGAQFQSPTGLRMNQSQLLSGYGNSLTSSPPVSAAMSSQYGVDNSTAKAIMNSRMSAFAKRSQSFVDRGSAAGRQSTLSAMTSAAAAESSVLADWGSPNGKLDWGVQGDDLNKLRKSATFNFRNNQVPKTATLPVGFDEPDLSWVNSLVKETPQSQDVGMLNLSNQRMRYQTNGASELHRREMMPLWLEHEKLMA